jgi:hypothetical protein
MQALIGNKEHSILLDDQTLLVFLNWTKALLDEQTLLISFFYNGIYYNRVINLRKSSTIIIIYYNSSMMINLG